MTAEEKIQRAATKMLLAYPWWASLYLHLKPVCTDTVPTMAVDGTHLYYNPAFTLKLSDKECLGVLLHETAHIALLHCFRRQHRHPELWNIACDQAANALLAADNITLPAGCVPPGPLDKTAEELYRELESKAQKIKVAMRDVYDPNALGKLGDAAASSGTTKALSERDWRSALAQSRGLLPAGIARMVGENAEPRKDWREELARFVHSTSRADLHTWNRLSRRIAAMPGWKRQPESTIAVCVDTSGSISDDILGAFLAEIHAIAAIAGMTLYLLSCDAAVTGVIEPGQPLPKTFVGGGGTDFRPAIAKSLEFSPDAIVYFTDGMGEFPEACETPVLWALTQNANVPFGQTINL